MKVRQGQCFLDMVIQGAGTLDAAFDMSVANEISYTEDLVIDDEIIASGSVKNNIIKLFGEFNIPATAIKPAYDIIARPKEGIGYMFVDKNFEVY